MKKAIVATTTKDGTFETDLPRDSSTTTPTSPHSRNCLAKILGGPSLLFTSGKKTNAIVAKVKGHDYYTNVEPLNFYSSCPPDCASRDDKAFGSSKTIDIPLPREWGLAPSSYYFPFVPIIGIP